MSPRPTPTTIRAIHCTYASGMLTCPDGTGRGVLDRVEPIRRRVQHLVDDVVAGRDEARREQADHDVEPQVGRDVGWIAADRGDDAGQDEDVLEPVIDARNLDVTAKRGARG